MKPNRIKINILYYFYLCCENNTVYLDNKLGNWSKFFYLNYET